MGNSHYCVERFTHSEGEGALTIRIPICELTVVPAVRVHQKGKVGWLPEGSSPFHFTTCSSAEPSVPRGSTTYHSLSFSRESGAAYWATNI